MIGKHLVKKYRVLPLLLLFILHGGCEKEDYTLPVEFKLNFALTNAPVMGGALEIEAIEIQLNGINVNGYREQGSDVFLSRNFEEGKTFSISPASAGFAEILDIPQGIYNPISFSFTFQPDTEEEELIDDIYEWLEDMAEADDLPGLQEDLGDIIEDYLEDLKPCIIVKGRFMHKGNVKHLVMMVNDPLTLQIHGKSRSGSSEVSLDRNIVNYGNLQFNPAYWFSVITAPILDDAFIGLIDGEAYVFLSKYVNSHIYSAVFNRIEESTILTINE